MDVDKLRLAVPHRIMRVGMALVLMIGIIEASTCNVMLYYKSVEVDR